jgi:hypothetical protein
LINNQLESVLWDGAVGIEEIAQSIIRGIGEITVDFAPGDQSAYRLVAIASDETVGANGCLDDPPNLIRLFFYFLVWVPRPKYGKLNSS